MGMIGICIGLSVVLIAFLCIRMFVFQIEKLEKGTYDHYGFILIVVTICCLYISNTYLRNEPTQQLIIIILSTFVMGLAGSCIAKQLMYDYKHKKLPFQRK